MKKSKKILGTILAAAMLLTGAFALITAYGATDFTDVADDSWYAEHVAYVHDNGIMSGTSDTSFSPSGAMTRAMLTTVLYRASGSPAVTASQTFTDVAAGAYYADAVAWASGSGIVSGYGDGIFGSNDPVSRAQIAVMLWRYAGSPASASGSDFADESSIPSYAAAAVDWAQSGGIVNGKTGNVFDPNGSATRAEVATILHNYLTASGSSNTGNSNSNGNSNAATNTDSDTSSHILVAYYSATGSTKSAAETIAEALGADLFEITPSEPYTSADLNYSNDDSRVSREHADETLRDVPLAVTAPDGWDNYDTVFIGYPIWWGIAAWPVNHFVTDNDFGGKTVIPFCTSASSGLGQSGTLLAEMAGSGDWQTGQRFSSGASSSTIEAWINSLGLTE